MKSILKIAFTANKLVFLFVFLSGFVACISTGSSSGGKAYQVPRLEKAHVFFKGKDSVLIFAGTFKMKSIQNRDKLWIDFILDIADRRVDSVDVKFTLKTKAKEYYPATISIHSDQGERNIDSFQKMRTWPDHRGRAQQRFQLYAHISLFREVFNSSYFRMHIDDNTFVPVRSWTKDKESVLRKIRYFSDTEL
jgi:hypothetical protein